MQLRLEVENPMLFPDPNYVPPIHSIVSYDLTEHHKEMDEWNREMARKERERGKSQITAGSC